MVPQLRSDLKIFLVNENNEIVYFFEDPFSIAPEPIILETKYYYVAQEFDDIKSAKQIQENILKNYNIAITESEIIGVANFMMANHWLETFYYHTQIEEINQYILSSIRPAICAGQVYPDKKEELEIVLENILSLEKENTIEKANSPKTILAPHIDFRVGYEALKCYSSAFGGLSGSEKADLVIMIGTAHYKNSNHFMLSKKNYASPLGIIESDKELIEQIVNNSDYASIDEMAHYPEHSLELHLIFAQYIYQNDFKVLPILCGGLQSYFKKEISPIEDVKYKNTLDSIILSAKSKYNKVIILSSGDLSHFGKKFGDEFEAETKFDLVKENDAKLIEMIKSKNFQQFYNFLKNQNDQFRICGLSPFYAAMYLSQNLEFDESKYGLWDENSTKSAVSFASFTFY